MTRGVTDEDPFAIFHASPLNETPQERAAREAKEAEAKRVSDQIDEQLKADRAAFKKQKNIVRVLLLGQAESGGYLKPPLSLLVLLLIDYR
jgi:guanine nucleotide-binding protein alpha-1 subunit